MEKKINYLSRDFSSIKEELIKFSNKYYPELADDFDDSSIGAWFIDLVSAVGDDLSYHTDRMYQETNLDSANLKSTVLNMARTNGLKVPGRKSSLCEVEISCVLPTNSGEENGNIGLPDWNYAPILQQTSIVSAGNYNYQLTEDVNFGEQFNSDGYSNRKIVPARDGNGNITGYTVTKSTVVVNGNSKVYRKVISSTDLKPFMEIVLPEENVLEIESIIFKETSDYSTSPSIYEYFIDAEEYRISKDAVMTYRFFECDSLADQWRFGSDANIDKYVIQDIYNPHKYEDYTEGGSKLGNGIGKSPSYSYTGFQFDLVLPSGVEIAKDDNNNFIVSLNESQETDHTLTVSKTGDSTYRFLAFSMTNAVYHANGGLVNVTFEGEPSDSNIARITSQVFTETNGTQPEEADTTFDINTSSSDLSVSASTRTSRYYVGKWKPLTQKFITEYTDNGYLKIIFGAGNTYEQLPSDQTTYADYITSKMINNDMLGILPKEGWTMYVLYRVGGGTSTNLGTGAINKITIANIDWGGNVENTDGIKRGEVITSFKVTNISTAVAGKDEPSAEEIKYLMKYNTSSQNRAVTVKDYKVKLSQMPAKYGAPFRSCVLETNNKIEMDFLGLNSEGQLDSALPQTLVQNVIEYMSHYKQINDYIEIRSGRIYNIGLAIDVFIDKNYNVANVVSNVINKVTDYFDVNNHDMGEDIFIGDLEKEITLEDGVLSLISLKVYKIWYGGYSPDKCPLPAKAEGGTCDPQEDVAFTLKDSTAEIEEIDLDAVDRVLYSDYNSMYEIKQPSIDIQLRVKLR